MLYPNQSDQGPVSLVYQERTKGLGSLTTHKDGMEFDTEAIVNAIEVKAKMLKKIQHSCMTSSFLVLHKPRIYRPHDNEKENQCQNMIPQISSTSLVP
jgi:hypothetical protein